MCIRDSSRRGTVHISRFRPTQTVTTPSLQYSITPSPFPSCALPPRSRIISLCALPSPHYSQRLSLRQPLRPNPALLGPQSTTQSSTLALSKRPTPLRRGSVCRPTQSPLAALSGIIPVKHSLGHWGVASSACQAWPGGTIPFQTAPTT